MDNRLNKIYEVFQEFPRISTDTRLDVKNSIFFALSGENFDGNKFAETALKNGAAYAVIDDEMYQFGGKYFLVKDSLEALQQLAIHHRQRFDIPVIGITGSNGKTTTKELVSTVLSSSKKIIATEGNLNNHIGVPLTVLKIKSDTKLAIIEMGANHIGEIADLCEIAQPTHGIITNIGKAHLEGFGSYEGVVTAKTELYKYLAKNNGKAIVNSDDPLLMTQSNKLGKFTYGSRSADVNGMITKYLPYLSVEWRYAEEKYSISTQLYGEYNFPNIMAAIASGVLFNCEPEKINSSIASFVSENNRSQNVKTETNNIILDAYNANPVSMDASIRSFKKHQFKNSWLILGDMFELGSYSLNEHESIIKLVEKLGFENVIFVGKDFFGHQKKYNHTFCKTTTEAESQLKKLNINNANILVKGSRGMKLETLLTYL